MIDRGIPIPPWDDLYAVRDYETARAAFRAAGAQVGVAVRAYAHPFDPNLTIDVARVGAESAERVLIVSSGVHGPELFFGSAVQSASLRLGTFSRIPTDTAVLLIHALNPWGAAHLRRNTEDNVDLCRNFLDFRPPLPRNPDYEALHGVLEVADRAQLHAQFRARQRPGEGPALIAALMAGQYEHPRGFEFGGAEPAWSHRALRTLLAEHSAAARHVAHLDLHSGLGPYGYGMLVSLQRDAALERARRWFGAFLTVPDAGPDRAGPATHEARGPLCDGITAAVPRAQVTSIVAEFGTYPMARNLASLLDDHWLFRHGDTASDVGRQIRAEMLEVHCPDDYEWRVTVWSRAQQLFRQALTGLATL